MDFSLHCYLQIHGLRLRHTRAAQALHNARRASLDRRGRRDGRCAQSLAPLKHQHAGAIRNQRSRATGKKAAIQTRHALLARHPHEALKDGIRTGRVGLDLILERLERPDDCPPERAADTTCGAKRETEVEISRTESESSANQSERPSSKRRTLEKWSNAGCSDDIGNVSRGIIDSDEKCSHQTAGAKP